MASLLEQPQMSKRPGPATQGRLVQLAFDVQHYDVTVHPSRAPARLRRQVVEHMFQTDPTWRDVWAVYDGNKNIFVPARKLNFDKQSFKVTLPEEDGRPSKPGRERDFRLDVQFAASVNLQALQAFCTGQLGQTNAAQMAITALNIALRHGPSIEHICKGASIYPAPTTPQDRFVISGGLEMWRGYYSSLRPAVGRLIVNVDSTAIAMVQEGDLIRVALAFVGASDPARLAQLNDPMRLKLTRFLRNVKVRVRVGSNQTVQVRKIHEFSAVPASTRSFEDQNGQKQTIQSYFRSLNINLRYPQLGCVRVTKTAWYPLETASVMPGNKFIGKLNPDQVAKVLEFTSKRPKDKRDLIASGLRKLGYNSNEHVKHWNLEVGPDPIILSGRVLQPPSLLGGGPSKAMATVRCREDGQVDARRLPFFKPATITSAIVIVFDSQVGDGRRTRGLPQQATESMTSMLMDACRKKGMTVVNPTPPIAYVGDIGAHEVGHAMFKTIMELNNGKLPQLCICFLTRSNSQYNTIKRLGEYVRFRCASDVGSTLQGFASQCMLIEKASKRDPSYFGNVALKINMKLGGINTILASVMPIPGVKNPLDDPYIVFGADVAHPSPGSVGCSVAALVASIDTHGGNLFATQTRAQEGRVEVITELEDMACYLLREFYKHSKKQPSRIIMYRDGVSEGQFEQVVVNEVQALRRACMRLDRSYKPLLTYVICGKRHHIRFFPQAAPRPGAKGFEYNTPPGTMVDDAVIHPTNWDWYATHHAGMLGTSRPVHYTVLVDENNFTTDQLMQTTNAFAWLFQRCYRAVGIASPAYYAHLACTRAKAHLSAARVDNDDSVSVTTDSERAQAVRLAHLEQAKADLKQVHANLHGCMHFL